MGQLGSTKGDQDIVQIAHEIESYFSDKSQAADTLEGIVHWWLFRQRLKEAEQNVKQAVDYLLSEGKINKRTLHDGTEIYFRE